MPTYKYLNDTGLERTLSKLKTYIDSQSGGSDGHGFIICDTSTMQVGDKIRVRSVYTVLEYPYNQTKEVITVGQPVVFTVPCYDYYKICTVQDIGGVLTEIGGVYKTVDYGQTLFINVLDKTTLGGIQGILNAHNESDVLNIGDEVTIKVNNVDWVMQIADINSSSHYVDFVSKYIWDTSSMTNSGDSYYTTSPANLRAKMQNFYNVIEGSQQALIKLRTKPALRSNGAANYLWTTYSDYVYPANAYEVFGGSFATNCPVALNKFPLFTTQENRIKTTSSGTIGNWWTCDGNIGGSGGQNYFDAVNNVGSVMVGSYNSSQGVVPCFRLTADS